MDSHMGKISPVAICAAWKNEMEENSRILLGEKSNSNVRKCLSKSGVENTTPQIKELLKIGFRLTV